MITIYGASGHAKVIRDVIIDQGIEIESIVDDNNSIETFQGIEVSSSSLLSKNSKVVIAIGDNIIRKRVSLSIETTFNEAIKHSSTVISQTVTLGKGSVVMPGAIINANTIVGEHCIINSGAIIEHDCNIGSYAHISPGAVLTGGVTIGEGVHVGAGAIILPGLHIGDWTKIGAGAVVLKDIPAQVTAVGNPAVILKKSNEKH